MRIGAAARLAACGLAALLAGCGGEVGGLSPRPSTYNPRSQSTASRPNDSAGTAAQPGAVRVIERDYHGWAALELSNGVVTVLAVPEIGGRVMEYSLGAENLLWVNERELGQLYAAPRNKQERVWHNFGGYKVWPAPQSDWGGPPDPLGSELDGGRWTGSITSARGESAAVRLLSPQDRQVTGLQIAREITMPSNTTEVRIQETFTNISQRKITWSIWDVTQLPGLVDAGGQPTGKAQVFVPLSPNSRTETGYWTLPNQAETDQYRTVDSGRLLQVTYRKQTGKVFADSKAGWVAYVDDERGLTYVKRFEVNETAQYPDDGATVEVYTSGKLPYLEMEVLSAPKELAPGESLSFGESWCVTRLNAPVVDVTEVAAIRKRPSVEATEQGLRLSGEFGVFAAGQVKLILTDENGEAVGAPVTWAASPGDPVTLDQVIQDVEGARGLAITLLSEAGEALGTIAAVELPGPER